LFIEETIIFIVLLLFLLPIEKKSYTYFLAHNSPGSNVIKLSNVCSLRIFEISWSVCLWQALQAKSNVCG